MNCDCDKVCKRSGVSIKRNISYWSPYLPKFMESHGDECKKLKDHSIMIRKLPED